MMGTLVGTQTRTLQTLILLANQLTPPPLSYSLSIHTKAKASALKPWEPGLES